MPNTQHEPIKLTKGTVVLEIEDGKIVVHIIDESGRDTAEARTLKVTHPQETK